MQKKSLLSLISLLLLLGCQSQEKKVKNVILFIGDGMGPQQVSLLYSFAKYSKRRVVAPEDFVFEKWAEKAGAEIAFSATEPFGRLVVDSACSATQLALGEFSRSEMIGLDVHGNRRKTILEKAQAKGMATGLVTDTRITHATPAAFAAHVGNRWEEAKIAEDLITTAPEVLLSGGLNPFVSEKGANEVGIPSHFNVRPRRKDGRNLLKEAVETKNYEIVFDRQSMMSAASQPDGRLMGFFRAHNMPDGIWYSRNESRDDRKVPSVLEMAQAAVKKLSQNKKGFFLMVEAGQIDWAAHQNDAATLLHQMIHFNRAVDWLADWAHQDGETLLLVTADHETGSFGMAYNVIDLPQGEKLSGDVFSESGKLFKPLLSYGKHDLLDRLYDQNMSYREMLILFEQLPPQERTAKRFRQIVNSNSSYKLSLKEAQEVIREAPNRFYVKGHATLGKEKFPFVHDFKEFYYNSFDVKAALIGRALAGEQKIVWGTGGHTATPVPVMTLGPKSARERFKGYLNHRTIGRRLQELLDLK